MSWTPPARKTGRYALGELLRDTADHLLLLTATPHKGDPENFSLFLQLLDADAYADVRSIREAMERRRAPFYLRRTKEAMVHVSGTQAGRHVDGGEDLHPAHPAYGRVPDGRRGARPLPGSLPLREAPEREGRGPGGRSARPRGGLPDVAVPASAGVQHPCVAEESRKPRAAARRRAEAGRGPGPHRAGGAPRPGRDRGDGGGRARAPRRDARSGDPGRKRRAGTGGDRRAPALRGAGPGGRGLRDGSEVRMEPYLFHARLPR